MQNAFELGAETRECARLIWSDMTRRPPPFPPDSHLVAEVVPSPNHEARAGGRAPDMILLHYTGMESAAAALARLHDENEPRVSAHYFIEEGGTIRQLVPEARRAWHAGLAYWDGENDINSCSIGIEIVNSGHDFDYPDFPERQIESVIALCRDLIARHAIRDERVLAHSDVAPGRKRDPGEKFPWQRLHAAGIGHWVEPSAITNAPLLAEGDCGTEVTQIQAELAGYGYGLSVTGTYDAATRDVVAAFQRHFRPARVDGVADSSTRETLRRLLASRPAPAA